jgi:Family of unknown function (DUF6524)
VRGITLRGIGTRFLIALALVCVTWNPTRFNYYDWALAQWSNIMPIVVLVGIVLAIAWIFFLRTTARSLGALGIILAVGLAATVLWVLFFYDIVAPDSGTPLAWIILVLLAAILAIGMSWSHLRRAWAGQADVDDVDEP